MPAAAIDPPPAADPTTPPPRRPGGLQLRPAPAVIGTRLVARAAGGRTVYDEVPLYETDLLAPHEEDRVVTNPLHVRNCLYLFAALDHLTRGQAGVRVFADRRIDFQLPGFQPLGPDVTVVTGATGPDDPRRGTFRVRSAGGTPLLVIEVISDSTRSVDLGPKFELYHRAGVRYYVLADLPPGAESATLAVEGYLWTEVGYEPMPADPAGTVVIPEIGAGLRAAGLEAVVVDAAGRPLPEFTALLAESEELRQRVAEAEAGMLAERQRADAERQRADAERQRADAERQRADTAETRTAELEAELRRLRGGN